MDGRDWLRRRCSRGQEIPKTQDPTVRSAKFWRESPRRVVPQRLRQLRSVLPQQQVSKILSAAMERQKKKSRLDSRARKPQGVIAALELLEWQGWAHSIGFCFSTRVGHSGAQATVCRSPLQDWSSLPATVRFDNWESQWSSHWQRLSTWPNISQAL